MTFLLRQKVGQRFYGYEMRSYRDAHGNARNAIVKCLGPDEPVYGVKNGRLAAVNRPLEEHRPLEEARGRSPEERRQELEDRREDARIEPERRKFTFR